MRFFVFTTGANLSRADLSGVYSPLSDFHSESHRGKSRNEGHHMRKIGTLIHVRLAGPRMMEPTTPVTPTGRLSG